MKILIMGIYPPPLGGVSTHIKRLKEKLESRGHECEVLNEGKLEIRSKQVFTYNKYNLLFKLLLKQADIYHFHTSNVIIRSFLGTFKMLSKKKVILTIHGASLETQLNSLKGIKRNILINSLKKIDQIVCVNEENTNMLLDFGFDSRRVSTINAFIKPESNQEEYNNLPWHVKSFLDDNKFIISANGNIRFFNNQDLYGVDLLIDLVYELKEKGNPASLLFALLGANAQKREEREYYESLKLKIKQLDLEDQILIYEVTESEFHPILLKSDVFIRPTNTDGFSLSLAEALTLGVPSLASDVVNRPKGTVVFKNRDGNSLLDNTEKVINNYKLHKEKLKNLADEDNFHFLMELYTSLLQNK